MTTPVSKLAVRAGVLLALAAGAMAACTTTETMRTLTPLETYHFRGSVETIATCILTDLAAADRDRRFDRSESSDGVHILARPSVADRDFRFADFDIRISADAGRRTLVELRGNKNVWGGEMHTQEALPVIEACGARASTHP